MLPMDALSGLYHEWQIRDSFRGWPMIDSKSHRLKWFVVVVVLAITLDYSLIAD